ncbi:MAG: hypothetical protein K2K75_11885 [Muribaculaceae bacterium]|nr:hypothetical protein [Muribaculaceae bacterium]
MISIIFILYDIFIGHKFPADLIRVINTVPEYLFVLAYGICRKTFRIEITVLLLDTNNYDSSIRIGERGIGRLEFLMRKSTLTIFEFYASRFLSGHKMVKVVFKGIICDIGRIHIYYV